MVTRHILIVDDEPKVGYFLGKSLELSKRDCRVSTARTGEEALEILERDHVDLLITDLRMPGVSGLDLIRWVRTTSPGTRTILITAYGSDQIKTEARRLEVYHYLTKPFNVRDFTQVVDSALQSLAVSTPGFTIISDSAFETLTERLERLRYETGARCAFLADMQGQRLAEVGPTEGLDITMLLTLLAGGFATSAELARRFNRADAANLFFQEGEDYDIYSSNAGENLMIAMLFEKSSQKGRLGMVWLYTRRAVEDVLGTLSKVEQGPPEQVLHEDFGATLMAELNSAFDDDLAGSLPTFTVAPVTSSPRGSTQTASRGDGGLRPAAAPLTPSPKPTASPKSATQARDGGGEPASGAAGLLTLEEAIARGLLPSSFEPLDKEQTQG